MGVFSRRVIFFPFPRAKADQMSRGMRGDQFDAEVKVEHWESKHNKPGLWRWLTCNPRPPLPASFHFLDDEGWRDAVGQLRLATDQLYIVAHGQKDSTSIGCTDGSVSYDAKQLCTLLEPHLPAGFCGVIKIYACESGEGFDRASGSYADGFAAYAYARWPDCTVLGYRGAIILGGPDKFKSRQVPMEKGS